MDSAPATQRPNSPPALDVREPVERSSPARPTHKSTINTPPSTPAAEPSSPETTTASDITEKMPAVTTALSTPPSTRSARGDSDLEDGETREDGPAAVSEANTVDRIASTAKRDVDEKVLTEQTSTNECEEQDDQDVADLYTVINIEEIVTTEMRQPHVE